MTEIREICPELAEVARTELCEDEALIPEFLARFRQWINEQPHLKARTNDQFLIAFLRFCKYDLEYAKRRIDYYYTYKTSLAADLVRNPRIDEQIWNINKAGIHFMLPKPAGPGGPRIHVTLMHKIDTSIYNVQDLFRFQMFRSEMEIQSDDNWVISGCLEIIDCKKLPYSLLRQYSPSLFRKMASLLEYGLPTNLKGTHIVNASREVQIVLSLVRSVMKEKQLLNIHNSIESLQKAIGKEYLPVEYGGDNGSFEDAMNEYEQLLQSFETYFLEEDQYGVQESLRKEKLVVQNSPTNETACASAPLDFD